MKTKFSVICLLLLSGVVLLPLRLAAQSGQSFNHRNQDYNVAWDRVGKTDPKKAAAKPKSAATGTGTSSTGSANRQPSGGDGTVWNAIQGRNWQRDYDVQVGNVILLRRSTDEPPPEGTKVIMRWRTPQEYQRQAYSSSKGPRNVPRGRFQF